MANSKAGRSNNQDGNQDGAAQQEKIQQFSFRGVQLKVPADDPDAWAQLDYAHLEKQLQKLPVSQRFDAFNTIVRGLVGDFLDLTKLEPHDIQGAPFDIKSLSPDLQIFKVSKATVQKQVPWLHNIISFAYKFGACYWPTAGVLGTLEQGEFTVFSVGANFPLEDFDSGTYHLNEIGATVQVEVYRQGFLPRAKKCPRKTNPLCTSGKCYSACRIVCKQSSHTERVAPVKAGLGKIVTPPYAPDQTWIVQGVPYTGPGELTMLFMGHWWMCEPCSRALVGAGVKNIVMIDPEYYKDFRGFIFDEKTDSFVKQ